MANIGHFDNQPGAVFNDQSTTIAVSQNNTELSTTSAHASKDAPASVGSLLHLNPDIKLIDLYIIIYGMWQLGMFVMDDGKTKARQEDVFNAFGTLLGRDFKNYKQSLNAWKNNKQDAEEATAILGKIRKAVRDYYEKESPTTDR